MLDENEDEIDSTSDLDLDNKERYVLALSYVNSYHRMLSSKLKDFDVEGSTKVFNIPEVPDYTWLYQVLFKQQKKYEYDDCVRDKNIGSISTPTFSGAQSILLKQIPRSEGSIGQVSKYNEETLANFIARRKSDNLDYSDAESQTVGMQMNRTRSELKEPSNILDLIKDRLLKEFLQDFSKTEQCKKLQREIKLVRSSFSVVNIQPRFGMLDYACKTVPRVDVAPISSYNQKLHDVANICSNTPRRVKHMFDIISKGTADSSKIFENAAFGGTNLDFSDSDSIILDDEEFERRSQKGRYPEENHQSSAVFSDEKSNPLKLTGKDITRLDEKMLSAIGLFTERGDVRPGVIDILEEQKKLKSNDSRNKQFRSKRQWDIQIHLKPKSELRASLPSVSSDKSFISLSSDIKLQVQNVESFESDR